MAFQAEGGRDRDDLRMNRREQMGFRISADSVTKLAIGVRGTRALLDRMGQEGGARRKAIRHATDLRFVSLDSRSESGILREVKG